MFFKIHGKYTVNTRKIHGKNTENTRKFAQHRIGHELGTNWARSVANLLQWEDLYIWSQNFKEGQTLHKN